MIMGHSEEIRANLGRRETMERIYAALLGILFRVTVGPLEVCNIRKRK